MAAYEKSTVDANGLLKAEAPEDADLDVNRLSEWLLCVAIFCLTAVAASIDLMKSS